MEFKFSERIALCYTIGGPTYKKSALENLKTRVQAPNIQYFVITDDKNYFSEVFADDILFKELSEFYEEYPEIEPHEFFFKTDDLKEYGDAFLKHDYVFPFSAMRFHLKLAAERGITNVGLLATDSKFKFHYINDELLSKKNIMYNAVSLWPSDIYDMPKLDHIETVAKEIWGIDINKSLMIYDEAARFYVFRDVAFMEKFFTMWHEMIVGMFRTNNMRHFRGTFMYNEEHMVSVIYDILGITHPDPWIGLFDVNHDLITERPWTVGAGPWKDLTT